VIALEVQTDSINLQDGGGASAVSPRAVICLTAHAISNAPQRRQRSMYEGAPLSPLN